MFVFTSWEFWLNIYYSLFFFEAFDVLQLPQTRLPLAKLWSKLQEIFFELARIRSKSFVLMAREQKFCRRLFSIILTKHRKQLGGNFSSTIILIIFWDFLMFYQTFLSPHVKLCTIITYKHGIYEFPHRLPNGLTLWILAN